MQGKVLIPAMVNAHTHLDLTHIGPRPFDPKAGHIPGSRNAPTRANLDADGRFLPADVLREQFKSLRVDGSRPVGVYCGSGVTAAHEIAALEIIGGYRTALYVGSWSQWSNHDLPVAVGK